MLGAKSVRVKVQAMEGRLTAGQRFCRFGKVGGWGGVTRNRKVLKGKTRKGDLQERKENIRSYRGASLKKVSIETPLIWKGVKRRAAVQPPKP